MGKFRQISTELWPLIDVRNGFLSLAFCKPGVLSLIPDFYVLLDEILNQGPV